MSNKIEELSRLNFEDYIWILFAILSVLNIIGNKNEKNYLKTDNNLYKNKSNKIFKFTIIGTFLIYIYFFIRNPKPKALLSLGLGFLLTYLP